MKQLVKSFELVKNNVLLLGLSIVVDAILFLVYGATFASINLKVMEHLTQISQIFGQEVANIADKSSIMNLIQQQPELAAHMSSVGQLLISLAVLTYVIFNLLGSISWGLSGRAVKKINFIH